MTTYEYETEEAGFGEFEEQEYEAGYSSPLSETEEMELAARLMEITDEEELEQFLGNLFKNVTKKVGGFLRSGVGRTIGGVLKNVAKVALPIAGGALGSFVAPGVGTMIGRKLGSMASNLFEVEPGELEMEDAEFEISRRFVRFAAASAANGARAPRRMNFRRAGIDSVFRASRRYAPGVRRRFRRFARPARWYYPAPVPYPEPEPVAAEPAPAPEPEPEPTDDAVPPNGPAQIPAQAPAGEEGEYGSTSPFGYGRRAHRGRWVRRGHKLVVLGV